MTKSEIVSSVYERLGLSKRECADLVDAFFDIIKKTLASGENVKLSGFGNFIVKEKRSRRGRNPQTGEEIEISKRKVLNYRLSQVLKDEINRDIR
ncbi:MAG: integration host factor subunit alpha [Syntrophorhabdaceae bacterium]|nr:integration host factor subunit alpha [Syntrophorhabdaceae bacterium]